MGSVRRNADARDGHAGRVVFDCRLHCAGRGPGRSCHSGADSRRIDQHLLHHQGPAEFDEADHHQEENGGDDREFGHRGTAPQ